MSTNCISYLIVEPKKDSGAISVIKTGVALGFKNTKYKITNHK